MNTTQIISALLNNNVSYKSMKELKNFKRPYNLRGKPRNFDHNGAMHKHLANAIQYKVLHNEWDYLQHSSCVYERTLYNKWRKNSDIQSAFKSELINIIFNYLVNHNVINNEYKNYPKFVNVVIKKLNEFKDNDETNKDRWVLYEKLMVLQLS